MEGAGGLCLQQDFPEGTAEDFVDATFRLPHKLKTKLLSWYRFSRSLPSALSTGTRPRNCMTRAGS